MSAAPVKLPAPGPADSFAFAARLAVGLVLIAAGAAKASSAPEEFAYIIEQYQLTFLSSDATLTIATFLPWVELLVGYALVLGWMTRPAAAAAAGMFGSFVFALASTKLRGLELPSCGCFGSSWHIPPSATLVLDLLLLFCCLAAFARGRERASLDNWADPSYTGAG